MRSPNLTIDRLIHAAHSARSTLEWTTDSLAGSDILDEGDPELSALTATIAPLAAALAAFDRYSDGRPVCTHVTIDGPGHSYVHLWPATLDGVADVETLLFDGRRCADPGDDRGLFAIYTNPTRCAIRVELTDPPHLHVVGDRQ